MNRRKIIYFLFIVFELLVAFFLDFLTDAKGPLLGEIKDIDQFQYAFGLVCAFSAILTAFLVIKKKQLNPFVRMALVMSGINMILMDYYFFFDTNLLYFIPVLAIAYMFIWPATED